MKKRDYIIIAGVIRKLKDNISIDRLVYELSIEFLKDNNNFNKEKFINYIYEN